jgi:hypothetical protein
MRSLPLAMSILFKLSLNRRYWTVERAIKVNYKSFKTTHSMIPCMKKTMALAAAFLVILTIVSCIAVATADNGIEVKDGDWLEYKVTVTGNPTPDLNVTWGRIDVKEVNGSSITVDVQTKFSNGTLLLEPGINLNVETGAVGDGFFIPTYLKVGDVYQTQYEGNITIDGTQTIEAGLAQREVFYGSANTTTYYWDKKTGIMVQATSELPNCTMNTKTDVTNIWQPQVFGVDASLFYFSATWAVAALCYGVFSVVRFIVRHKKTTTVIRHAC